MTINNIKERYQQLQATMADAPEGRIATATRQNRRAGSPTQFEKAAVDVRDIHFLDLSKKRMPSGEVGLLCRLNNAKTPTEKFPNTVLVGGQSKNQAVTKWLNVSPTDEGRGVAFAWDDELLPVFLDLLEVLATKEPEAVQLPRVLGAEPSRSIVEALQAAGSQPGEYNVLQTPCSGEVTYITDPDTGTSGYIRIVQKQDENGLTAEENVHQCDEIFILPGTRPIVKVGQQVEMCEPVLGIDPAAVSALPEAQLADLVAAVSLPVTAAGGQSLAEDPAMYVGTVPLYAGSGGKVPKGKLYFDVVNMVDVDGSPVYRVFSAGNGIFTSGNVRIDLRASAINWPRQKEFVPPTPRDQARAESRQRMRNLRSLGEEAAFAQLVSEAVVMPVKEYDLKLDHISSGPFPLSAELSGKVSFFALHVRHGDHARLAPPEKAVKINEFLEELVNDKPTAGEAS